jgi:chitinase
VVSKTTRTVTLRWNAATATDFPIASYQIVRDGATTTAVDTTALVTGLTPNTAYSFTVRAVDTRWQRFGAQRGGVRHDPRPGQRHHAAVGAHRPAVTAKTATSVNLTWNASTDANEIAGYEISTSGGDQSTTTQATGNSATVSGLQPLTAYTFAVRARDTYDNLSAASAAVSATTDDIIGSGNHATCRCTTGPAVPARPRASSTVSTWTGNGRVPRGTPGTTSHPRTRRTTPR